MAIQGSPQDGLHLAGGETVRVLVDRRGRHARPRQARLQARPHPPHPPRLRENDMEISELGWAGVLAHIDVEVAMDEAADANAEEIVLAALKADTRIQQVKFTRTVQVLGE